MKTATKAKPKKSRTNRVLVLRTCNPDMTSSHGFEWPKRGPVECSDWNPKPCCGGGLHGLLWGEGDGSLLNWCEDAVWLVVSVQADSVRPRLATDCYVGSFLGSLWWHGRLASQYACSLTGSELTLPATSFWKT